MKDHRILGDPINTIGVTATMNGLQNSWKQKIRSDQDWFDLIEFGTLLTDSGCCLSVQAETYVVGVSMGSIFKVNLPLDAGSRKVLQVLQFIDTGISVK